VGAVAFKQIIYTADPSLSYATDVNVVCRSFHINSRSAESESASVMGDAFAVCRGSNVPCHETGMGKLVRTVSTEHSSSGGAHVP
jgi:hypothetical protein